MVFSKKFFMLAALLFATLIGVLATNAVQANAESSVYSDPQTNVFFRYGVGPGLASEGYVYTSQIYKNGTFVNTASSKFGYIYAFERGELIGIHLERGEYIVQIETVYQLVDGTQIHVPWKGKGRLPVHRKFGEAEASLETVDVGVHSPKLPNQPPEPEYTEMH